MPNETVKVKTLLEVIGTDPDRDRSPVSRGMFASGDDAGDADPVQREGGSRRAGLIEGASLIAAGEAEGHFAWIDGDALDQVVKFGNESSSGVKTRFTHPSMSGDGLGSYLGRAKNLRRSEDGPDRVLGDVHLSPTSRDTPQGDLGGYVLDLAEEDPEAFGMSIVFDHDYGAEKEFEGKHSNEDGEFTSPDDANENDYPHIRLSALHGADFVDEPAANPDGLFHVGGSADVVKQAEATLEYALGLEKDVPDSEACGGLSAERMRGFLTRFLESRGLAIKLEKKDPDMADESTATADDETAEDAADDDKKNEDTEPGGDTGEATDTSDGEASAGDSISRVEFKRFVDRFGAEAGGKYLADGVSYEDALGAELDETKKKLATRETDRGETEAIPEYPDGDKNLSVSEKRKLADRKAGHNLPIRMAVGTPSLPASQNGDGGGDAAA